MSVLSDRDIRHRLNGYGVGPNAYDPADRVSAIGITPWADGQIQPASIDLTLDDEFLAYPIPDNKWAIDMDNVAGTGNVPIRHKWPEWILEPGELLLASTAEFIEVPHDLIAVVNGKSSLARLGLLIHITAGFIDPGFRGKITLEMYNLNKRPIILRAGKPICQLSFIELSSVVECPYGHPALKSKYQDQERVTASKYDG